MQIKRRKVTGLLLISTVILLVLSTTAFPWDGRRKGFILGFGAGAGITRFDQDIVVWDTDLGWIDVKADRQTKAAIMTDFKIEYTPHSE